MKDFVENLRLAPWARFHCIDPMDLPDMCLAYEMEFFNNIKVL